MSVQPLENKTIRPGSLMGYSYYHAGPTVIDTTTPEGSKNYYKRLVKLVSALIILLILATLYNNYSTKHLTAVSNSSASNSVVSLKKSTVDAKVGALAAKPANICTNTTEAAYIEVSISQQKLWACSYTVSKYTTPVITGQNAYADTVTPTGTYYIYAKETDLTLTGSDENGSWNDPVSYWMPFLSNQYGIFGLHDATWRNPDLFGHVSPSSNQGSQGCVELPLASAAWLYNFVSIGTPVTINS